MLEGLGTYIYYRTELWELCLEREGGCITRTILLGELGVVPYIAETVLWEPMLGELRCSTYTGGIVLGGSTYAGRDGTGDCGGHCGGRTVLRCKETTLWGDYTARGCVARGLRYRGDG